MRKELVAGAAAVGAALIGGAALYYVREKQTEEPDYRALATDGDFQVRDYPAITVAETVVEGPRRQALSDGFNVLADYIFAKSREGEKLAMSVPVMQESTCKGDLPDPGSIWIGWVILKSKEMSWS